jgi:CRISPR system Cascade subunit CasC
MPDARNVFVEFHALTSHVPSNLNRDDLGTPKTAVFGGVRRLRISSQCLKRTWRMSPYFRGQFAEELLGTRTASLADMVLDELKTELSSQSAQGLLSLLQSIGRAQEEEGEEPEEEAAEVVPGSAERADTRTAHLLFLSRQEIQAVTEFARANRDALTAIFEPGKGRKGQGANLRPSSEKIKKLREALKTHLAKGDGRNAVDVALFGRFVTSDEFPSVSAAMQVAHALGTQKVELEYDYFSAMDDRREEPGAGHIGESEFASSVFYKYAVCDLALLRKNLAGDVALAARSMKAIALALARSVPSGKRNSTAPQNPADHMEAVVRKDAPISLANAFLKPVTAADDVMALSIERLRDHSRKYEEAYSTPADTAARFVLCLKDVDNLVGERCRSLDELASRLETAVTSALS